LHSECNKFLGQVFEQPKILENVKVYLEESSQNKILIKDLIKEAPICCNGNHSTSCKKYQDRYSITLGQKQFLFKHQNESCKICEKPIDFNKIHIDHDHNAINGVFSVRGLLCLNCNLSLGLLRDDPSRILNAIKYLDSPIAREFG
jgi:hypothetical protein